MLTVWLVTFLALMGSVPSSIGTDCSYNSLMNHLNLISQNENPGNMRPVKNWTTPTVIMLDMLVFGILELNEKSQTLTCHVWSAMSWTDEFLTWQPEQFCEIKHVVLSRNLIWTPDINIVEDISDTGSTVEGPYANLTNKGHIMVSKSQRLTTTCQMDLYRFPFDTQSCNISFLSTMHIDRVIIKGHSSNASITELSEHFMVTKGEWELVNINIVMDTMTYYSKTRGKLTYKITLKRRPLLYLIIFILPLFYFLVLDISSFFISEARGEKLGFKVTILLSISVLLLILKDILPSTDRNLPLIALYCMSIFTLVGFSLLEFMLVSWLIEFDSKVDKDVQDSAKAIVEKTTEAGSHRDIAGTDEGALELKEGTERKEVTVDLTDPHLLQLILEEVKTARQERFSTQQEPEKRKPGYYERVAGRLDVVFFVLYVVAAIILFMYILSLWGFILY